MDTFYKITIGFFLLLTSFSKLTVFGDTDYGSLSSIEESQSPDGDLITVETTDRNEGVSEDSTNQVNSSIIPTTEEDANDVMEKRSIENVNDLEAAAGTNVLRPLFVYRQQMAYRDRVNRGVVKYSGIRPRF